ncbi:winged helix-turn-helix transcriptional regulator [Bacillus circulans]|jgi:DNA-binding transcriptional ArsR family regulator|uniref:winged helix-turn-helix domain-containing protein n=1 Tax=Niallia TaxID=2837506 RepID=UPI00156122FF|nr:winged helix-turn-helix domain-containing protein [Niallia circulans]NRG26790.1 winged helix-turn-helix transcriptional regulator [Niallia circulans]
MEKQEMEIAKVFFDEKKRSILHSIEYEAKAIKHIAEEMKEKQSRLYYHMKKLEELGLVKVVKEEKLGNIIQKYYKAAEWTRKVINLSPEDLHNNPDMLNNLYPYINRAIDALKQTVEDPSKDRKGVANLITEVAIPKTEWNNLNEEIRQVFLKYIDAHKNNEEKVNLSYLIMSYIEETE